MDYLTVKYVHIVSSTILFGTGIGSAFYMVMANRRKNIRGEDIAGIYLTIRHVVIADWLFTAPSVIIQLASGIALTQMRGYELTDKWIMYSLALYFFAGACWLPVVWIQIKMRDMAKEALDRKTVLPGKYWLYDRWWILLGSAAFPAILSVFYLMVFKPG